MIKEWVDRLTRRNRIDRFPMDLVRRRIYILPTAQGILFLLVVFTMLLGSINYNNNLGFLFTFLLSSLAFVSLLHTHQNLVGLRVHAAAVLPVFAGERAALILTLGAGSRVRVGLCLGFKDDEPVSVNLLAGDQIRVSVPMTTRGRGLFSVGTLTVSSAYPFGLFRTWSTLYPDLDYLVYPRPMAGPLHFGDENKDPDQKGAFEVKGTDDFKELRPYRPGDSLSRLSWKSFSRGRGLYTKEFTSHAGASLMLSWDALPQVDTETRLSRLCDMIQQAHRMALGYGLTLPGMVIPPGEPKDLRHYHLCLRQLALFGSETSKREP